MVSVFNDDMTLLMPCTEKMARKRIERGTAKPYWCKGIFCIILQYHVSHPKFQKIILGCDPGSKFEGFTIITEKKVILNIESLAVTHVKDRIKTRRIARRTRRNRNTPYRKCRFNRKGRTLPPSTKARWQAKLRVIKFLISILPITDVAVEDVCAILKPGSGKWNLNFSPIQTGKWWFYSEIHKLNLHLITYQGYETKQHCELRDFIKTSQKNKMNWDAHCVDSHSLCEMLCNKEIEPVKKFYLLKFLVFSKRQLHFFNFDKGQRKRYGGTMCNGIKKGTLVNHPKWGLCYVSGYLNTQINTVVLYNYKTTKRVTQSAKIEDLEFLTNVSFVLQLF